MSAHAKAAKWMMLKRKFTDYLIYAEQLPASLVSNDGTYAGARGASSADSIRSTAVDQFVGQAKEGGSGFYVYRTVLIFDTSLLSGATLTGVIVELWENNTSAVLDPQSMVVIPGDDAADSGVVLSDFGLLLNDTLELGIITSADFITGTAGYRQITLNAAGLARVNKAGLTKLGFRSTHDINNIPDTGFIERNRFDFYGSTEITGTRRPRLRVGYER